METKIKALIVFFFVLSLVFLFLCVQRAGYKIPVVELQTNKPISEKGEERNVGLANPASENCGFKKGSLEIRKNPGGSEYGVCVFAENKECEEWALYRGDCPEGGVDVSGVNKEAVKFCLISGGRYLVENRECELKNGKKCQVDELFQGNCQ
jgi:putative hemolysin